MSIYKNRVSVSAATSLTNCAVGKHHICSATSAYTVALPSSGMAVGDVISFEGDGDLEVDITLDAGTGILIKDSQQYTVSAYDVVLLKWGGSNWNVVAVNSSSGSSASISEASNGYLIGGSDSSGSIRDTDEYTPDTWASKTDLPVPDRLLATAVGL